MHVIIFIKALQSMPTFNCVLWRQEEQLQVFRFTVSLSWQRMQRISKHLNNGLKIPYYFAALLLGIFSTLVEEFLVYIEK